MVQFLTANYGYIVLALLAIGGFVVAGKKHAQTVAMQVLTESKDFLLANVEQNEDKYLAFLTSKLPVATRVFLTSAVAKTVVSQFISMIATQSK